MKLLRCAGLLTLLASPGCAYKNPVAPSAATVDLSLPSQMTLSASPGTGAQAGIAALTARVLNANGVPVANVIVMFTTSGGSVSPTRVATAADGRAAATLSASDTAEVTAAAGSLSARSLVVAQTPVVSTPTPTPNPSPIPAPTPTTPPPAVFLNVSASATTGVPLAFAVSSSVTGGVWTWVFGDGASAQTTAFSTTHAYAKAGSYTASVFASGTAVANTTITVTDPAPAPTTPTPSLSVTLTCTPVTHGSATSCNTNETYNGATLAGGTVTGVAWDWGDGTIADNSSTQPVKTHIYVNAGTYTVFATVTANTSDGAKTGATSKSVIVP